MFRTGGPLLAKAEGPYWQTPGAETRASASPTHVTLAAAALPSWKLNLPLFLGPFQIKWSPAHYGHVIAGEPTNKGIDAISVTAFQNIHGVAGGFTTRATAR